MFTALTHITLTASALTVAALGTGAAAVPAAGARSASAAMPACRTSDLSARLGPIGAGAGQRYETLTLVNRSHHVCHTYGYVGMQFLDASGRTLPTTVVRDRSRRPQRVVLAPGARARTQLHWSVVPGRTDPSGQCGPAPRPVEVTPPDQPSHLILGWGGGQVCERGRVSVTRLA